MPHRFWHSEDGVCRNLFYCFQHSSCLAFSLANFLHFSLSSAHAHISFVDFGNLPWQSRGNFCENFLETIITSARKDNSRILSHYVAELCVPKQLDKRSQTNWQSVWISFARNAKSVCMKLVPAAAHKCVAWQPKIQVKCCDNRLSTLHCHTWTFCTWLFCTCICFYISLSKILLA